MSLAKAVAGVALIGGVLAWGGPVVAAPVAPVAASLTVTATIGLGGSSALNKFGPSATLFADAPNDVVYFATGSVVKAVRGNAAPTVVAHLPRPALAVAATVSDLYVETGTTIRDYAVPGQALRRTWTLPTGTVPSGVQGPPTSAGLQAQPGVLWEWSDWSTDESGFEYATVIEISTATSAVRVIDRDAYPGFVVAGPTGLYYEDTVATGTTSHNYIVHALVSGKRVFSHPTGDMDAPLALEPGYVAAFAIREPSGKPYVDEFAIGTLALVSSAPFKPGAGGVVGTPAGPLGIAGSCNKVACAGSTIVHVDPVTGGDTQAAKVPDAELLLYGSHPAVVTSVDNRSYLVRLS
jgi:hypothetical protein